MLRNAKAEVIALSRRNRNSKMRMYRYKKGVKNRNTLLAHIKHRKYVNEKVHNALKVSNAI